MTSSFGYFRFRVLVTLALLIAASSARATENSHEHAHDHHAAMEGKPTRTLMLHGNAFTAGIFPQGPRGRSRFAAPNMFMAGLSVPGGERHVLAVDLMGTLERWTLPQTGYPELFQVGERDEADNPYLDAQHPHSSPIMGLTLSDTIRLGDGSNHLKLFVAPRGESTEGPIAFMHRPTGMANPDAPLGHHVGQDVGHISSTVLGAGLQLGSTRIEASAFNGTEPEPTHVDLPIGAPNSFATRIIQDFGSAWTAMASIAYVKEPEHGAPDPAFYVRYSASIYGKHELANGWRLHSALIYGGVRNFDRAAYLSSLGGEFLLSGDRPRVWGRVEVLQRTSAELQIASAAPDDPLWIQSFTLGYTHILARGESAELGLGVSGSRALLPAEFRAAYGGNPWTGRVFLQLSGMKMWGF